MPSIINVQTGEVVIRDATPAEVALAASFDAPMQSPLETLLTALAEAQTLEEVRLAAAAAAGVTP